MESSKTQCCGECAVDLAGIVEKYGADRRNLIPILHDVQKAVGYVSPEMMEDIADALGINVAQVHGVATFYTLFYTRPQGTHIVRLCDSPPCHIEGSRAIREAVSRELGVAEGETTGDGRFTFEVVSCMGLCGVAPAMMIDDDVYGNLKPEMIPGIIGKYTDSARGEDR